MTIEKKNKVLKQTTKYSCKITGIFISLRDYSIYIYMSVQTTIKKIEQNNENFNLLSLWQLDISTSPVEPSQSVEADLTWKKHTLPYIINQHILYLYERQFQ